MTNCTFDAYIAIPYSSPYYWVREYRFRLATEYASVLVQRGLNPFSPITHSHPMATHHGLKGDWESWQSINKRIIPSCEELHIITCDGWKESIGVGKEFEVFEYDNKRICYIDPITFVSRQNLSKDCD